MTVTRPFVVGYVGEWRAGQACGTGTFTFESGAQFEGKWDNRQLKAKAKHDVLNLAVEIAGEPPDPQVPSPPFLTVRHGPTGKGPAAFCLFA